MIGGNRIEIILPQASNEEVEDVKKMLTDVGSLEFRILANRKHDGDVIAPGTRAGRACQAAEPVQVGAGSARVSTGTNPTIDRDTITDLQAEVEEGPLRGNRGLPDRQGLRRALSKTEPFKIRRNTTNTLNSRSRPRLEVDHARTGSSTTRARSAGATRTARDRPT